MIDGVRILSTNTVVSPTLLGYIIIAVAVVIILFIDSCINIFIFDDTSEICLIVLIFVSLFLWFKISDSKNPLLAKQETEYIVSISDNVSFNDFKEKYKIIDKDDNIYTIRKKD